MPEDDAELLRTYVRTESQDAFSTLVNRKLPLVYSAALRRTNGDTAMAEDIAQTVFALMARKADSLQRHPVLTGWLFATTHFVANQALRERRRRERREALMIESMQTEHSHDVSWEEMRPVIDRAMLELSEADRSAVLLRYFENRTFVEVAAALNLSENTARMRVNRALETIRSKLAQLGITSTAAALGLSLSTHGATTVSPALAAVVAQGAIGAGISGQLIFAMTMSSLKLPAAVAVAVGAIAYGVLEHTERASAQRENSALTEEVALLQDRLSATTDTPPRMAPPPTPQQSADQRANAPAADPADPATNPEARSLHLARQMANTTINIKPYFKQLGLSEEQWDRYLIILQSGLEVELDAQALARANNLSAREQELAMVESMSQVRRDLIDVLGPEANQQLIDFNRRLPLRPLAEELASKLAFSEYPLSPAQGDAMMTILMKHGGLRLRGANWVLPEEAMAEMSGILLPQQYETLTAQQAARRADQGLNALRRSR